MRKFFQDFKKFISKGNIIDMAVGVIVGNAFSAIVKALTDKIIMPFINYLLALGGGGLSSAYTFLKIAYKEENGQMIIDLANSIYIDWGAFITAILNFFIIAMTLFIVLKVAMKSRQFLENATEKVFDGLDKYNLSKADRKELKKRGISKKDRVAVAAYLKEKEEQEQAKKLAEEEAKKAKEEDAKRNTTEYILKEIRDLLSKTVKVDEEKPTEE